MSEAEKERAELLEVPCDFYLAGGHSVGRASLCIYLSFFGICTSVGEFWKGVRDRRRTHTLDFIRKYRRAGAPYVGMAVDCDMWDYPGEKVLGWEAPVIWLVRDPVLLFTSFINAYVGNYFSSAFYGQPSLSPIFRLEDFCRMTLDHPAEFFQHYRLLKNVPQPLSVTVVDTEETLPAGIEAALARILAVFKLDPALIASRRDQITISFGSLHNRLHTLPHLPLDGPGGQPLNVWPVRREMLPNTEFWNVGQYQVLTSRPHHNDNYDIIYFADQPLAEAESYLTPANLERLQTYLERGLKLADFMEGYCRAHSFKPEEVAETIRRTEPLRQKFQHFWETDWLKVDDYRPGHSQTWAYARRVID